MPAVVAGVLVAAPNVLFTVDVAGMEKPVDGWVADCVVIVVNGEADEIGAAKFVAGCVLGVPNVKPVFVLPKFILKY